MLIGNEKATGFVASKFNSEYLVVTVSHLARDRGVLQPTPVIARRSEGDARQFRTVWNAYSVLIAEDLDCDIALYAIRPPGELPVGKFALKAPIGKQLDWLSFPGDPKLYRNILHTNYGTKIPSAFVNFDLINKRSVSGESGSPIFYQEHIVGMIVGFTLEGQTVYARSENIVSLIYRAADRSFDSFECLTPFWRTTK